MNYEILEEMMGGEKFFMIYKKRLFGSYFFERWNSRETAERRMRDLGGE
jgi:hypothetical protein